MKALILDGSRPAENLGPIRDLLAAELSARGYEVEALPLAEMKIAPCTGCFNCWFKTPGSCAQHDDQEQVLRAILRSDLCVVFSPVVFGGYSPPLKAAIDRSVPDALPLFETRGGNARHPSRYGHQYCPPAKVISSGRNHVASDSLIVEEIGE